MKKSFFKSVFVFLMVSMVVLFGVSGLGVFVNTVKASIVPDVIKEVTDITPIEAIPGPGSGRSSDTIEEDQIIDLDLPINDGIIVSSLFFSEYIEGSFADGSSFNKAVEIYNASGLSIDLSGYSVVKYSNGNTTPTSTINLSGILVGRDVYVVCHSSAGTIILSACDLQSGSLDFNGDDAIVLKNGSTIIDVIGQIGFDPGTEWGSGLTSTADNTLVRKFAILSGDINGSDSFDPAIEWDGYATNTFSYLGAHAALIDAIAPILTITLPADNSYTNNNTIDNLNFTASDDIDKTLDYTIYVDDEDASEAPISTGTLPSGGGIGTSLPAQTDGAHIITVKITDDAGNSILKSITVNIDTVNPIISSVVTRDPNTVEVLFNEELQNNLEGHRPQISDFEVYNGDTRYGINSVSYLNKKVTITLTNPIQAGDNPRLQVNPIFSSLVDLADNYFNDGGSYDTAITDEILPIITVPEDITTSTTNSLGIEVTYIVSATDVIDSEILAICAPVSGSVFPIGITMVNCTATDTANNTATKTFNITVNLTEEEGGHSSSGSRIHHQNLTQIPGCGPEITGFSTTTGQSCEINIPHNDGQVLGAETFNFTRNLRFGMVGDDALELHKKLTELGYYSGPIDNKFQHLLEAGVKAFQKANSPLAIDGIVGPLTRVVLNQ